MDIRLIDHHRTVTVVPTKDPKDDPWGAMNQLAAQADPGGVENHQVELVMDKEFRDALEGVKPETGEGFEAPKSADPSGAAIQSPTFKGIIVTVTGT